MEHAHEAQAALTVAVALAAGVVCQVLAHHARIPGIVLLLAAGVVLGPDVLNAVRPETLGPALQALVGFAVAIILFEGGMNLNLGNLWRAEAVIRRLLMAGAIVTPVGGAVAAHTILGWDWRSSILFGTLVIVTGPTVVTPLLRRLKVEHGVAHVLEAEGVLIDAMGAVIAVVVLEVALHPTGSNLALGVIAIGSRLGVGLLFGLVGGGIMVVLLRIEALVPEGLENVFTLSLVLLLFQVSNALMAESGIAATTVAGLLVGNSRTLVRRELAEFKEQLTVLLIGMLFVLLAADVRMAEVEALGVPGLLTVLALIVVVRPVCVLLATRGSRLSIKQRLFISWIGPRGIVAAAVASLFASELAKNGVPGASELRALVFLVIAVTVTIAGLTGGFVAQWLGLRRKSGVGWVVFGANDLGLVLGRALLARGEEVVFLDGNAASCKRVEAEGLEAICSNALEERTLDRVEMPSRRGAIAVTPNEEVNLMFAQKVRREAKVRELFVALDQREERVTPELVERAGAHVLFGRPQDLEAWPRRVASGETTVERWSWGTKESNADVTTMLADIRLEGVLVPLVWVRGGRVAPWGDEVRVHGADEVTFVVSEERAEAAHRWLTAHGWNRLEDAAAPESEPAPATAPDE